MRTNIIACPKCGYQYLAGEIYVPKSFVGEPIKIERDTLGHIINVIGTDVDSTEYYCCDNCDTPFMIDGNITFKTTTLTDDEFKEAMKLKPRISKVQLF